MKNLFKLMLLTITMFIAGSSFALAGNDNDSIQILETSQFLLLPTGVIPCRTICLVTRLSILFCLRNL